MESFDRDPGWEGINNRTARSQRPRIVRQDFGFSSDARHGSGARARWAVSFLRTATSPITPERSSRRPSSGRSLPRARCGWGKAARICCSVSSIPVRLPSGELRNTIAIRLNGRGDRFFAYVEACTSKWRANGDTTPFPSVADPNTGRLHLVGYPSETRYEWKLGR